MGDRETTAAGGPLALARSGAKAVLLVVALGAGVWSGVSITRTLATSSSIVTGSLLDPQRLYDLGISALSLDIINSDFVSRVNRGPARIEQADVARVLVNTYDIEDTRAKGREVHASLVGFVDEFERSGVFRVDIAEHRRPLVDSLSHILVGRYRALPECEAGTDVGVLLDAVELKLFGGSGDEFYLDEHPDCRPPGVIAGRVEDGIVSSLEEMAASGPDSIDVFPEEPADSVFAARIRTLQTATSWSGWAGPVIIAIAVFGAGAIGAAGVGLGPVLISWATGITMYGVAVSTIGRVRLRSALDGSGTVGEASEIWAELGMYALSRLTLGAGVVSALVGAVVVLGVYLARRRTRS
jgi:hypothetical protein